MEDYTQHTIYLQDGTLFNFKKRFNHNQQTLVTFLLQVKDGRSRFGKRHSLFQISTPLPILDFPSYW